MAWWMFSTAGKPWERKGLRSEGDRRLGESTHFTLASSRSERQRKPGKKEISNAE